MFIAFECVLTMILIPFIVGRKKEITKLDEELIAGEKELDVPVGFETYYPEGHSFVNKSNGEYHTSKGCEIISVGNDIAPYYGSLLVPYNFGKLFSFEASDPFQKPLEGVWNLSPIPELADSYCRYVGAYDEDNSSKGILVQLKSGDDTEFYCLRITMTDDGIVYTVESMMNRDETDEWLANTVLDEPSADVFEILNF